MKEQKGITLVALVITIIVMLILVAVSVTVALQGGLFQKAKTAANNTNTEAEAERSLSNGAVTVNNGTADVQYNSVNEYINSL